jgi:predicted nucleotidyltransferase
LVTGLRRALHQILGPQPVVLAYLYGSTTTGRVNPFSDVDIALLVEEGLTPRERLKLLLSLQVDLSDMCDISNADVRIINHAPLVFRYLPIHRRLQDWDVDDQVIKAPRRHNVS